MSAEGKELARFKAEALQAVSDGDIDFEMDLICMFALHPFFSFYHV